MILLSILEKKEFPIIENKKPEPGDNQVYKWPYDLTSDSAFSFMAFLARNNLISKYRKEYRRFVRKFIELNDDENIRKAVRAKACFALLGASSEFPSEDVLFFCTTW